MRTPPWKRAWPVDRATRRDRRLHRVALLSATATLAGAAVLTTSSDATASEAAPVPFSEIFDPIGAVAASFTSVASTGTLAVADATATVAQVSLPTPPVCPVPTSEFIDSWGFGRSGGRRHKGVDMMARHGDPIFAPTAGVVRPSNSRLGGIGFYLDDADGNTYFGSHLASLLVTGPVEAGDQIGTVGSTGNASAAGPHLHFEVMAVGVGSTNPYPYVAEWCAPEPEPEPGPQIRRGAAVGAASWSARMGDLPDVARALGKPGSD